MSTKTIFPRMHVSLHVRSIEETINFYDRFFNAAPAKTKEKYVKYELDQPALTISFLEKESGIQSSFGHLGIQVETKEELNEKLNLARGHKLVQLEELETTCCYAIQDKFWVTDPDGYEWEVYHFLGDDEQMGGREDLEGKACCTPETKEEGICC